MLIFLEEQTERQKLGEGVAPFPPPSNTITVIHIQR